MNDRQIAPVAAAPCRHLATAASGRGLSKPAGHSLLEVLVVIAVTGVIFSSLAFTVRLLFRADRQLRHDMTYGVVLPRLARQLRADAHAAGSLETTTGGSGQAEILFSHADGTTVRYRPADLGVERVSMRGEETLHREQFRLGSSSSVRWEEVAGPPPFLRLHIQRGFSTRPSEARQRELIEAAIGLDSAFQGSVP